MPLSAKIILWIAAGHHCAIVPLLHSWWFISVMCTVN